MRIHDTDSITDALQSGSTPTYMADYATLREYYKDTYKGTVKGHDAWVSKLATDLAPFLSSGGKELKKPRAAALRNVERFQKSGKEPGAKYQAALKELGQTLSPIKYTAPSDGFMILFHGEVLVSDECEERDFEEPLSANGANALLQETDTHAAFLALMEVYFPSGLVTNECGSWEMDIVPVG